MVQHYLNRTFTLSTGELYINSDAERTSDVAFDVWDERSASYIVRQSSKTVLYFVSAAAPIHERNFLHTMNCLLLSPLSLNKSAVYSVCLSTVFIADISVRLPNRWHPPHPRSGNGALAKWTPVASAE